MYFENSKSRNEMNQIENQKVENGLNNLLNQFIYVYTY